jgi:hypothetical protein
MIGIRERVYACLGWLEVPLDGLSGYLEGLGWRLGGPGFELEGFWEG